jgi:SagB-type dehydrogenase family enzyme
MSDGTVLQRQRSVVIVSGADDSRLFNVRTGSTMVLPGEAHVVLLERAKSARIYELGGFDGSARHSLEQCLGAYIKAGWLEAATTQNEAAASYPWTKADLLLHLQTRGPFHSPPRVAEQPDQLRPSLSVEKTERPKQKRKLTLEEALDCRCSTYSDTSISLETARGLLRRALKVRSVTPHPQWQTVESRRYPSAGGLHPLHVYFVSSGTDGVAGIYRWEPCVEDMSLISADAAGVSALLSVAAKRLPIQVEFAGSLLIITADYQRVAAKYNTQAYRFILLEAGALLQTFALLAAEENLCLSAIGSCDPQQFASLVGHDSFLEPSILDIVVGRHREEP